MMERRLPVKRNAPDIKIVVHHPDSVEAKKELARRVAVIHAGTVASHIQNLNCTNEQKELLLKSVSKLGSENT